DVSDLAADARADAVVVLDHIPRVGFELTNAQGDFLVVLLDAQNDGVDFVADLEDFVRLVDPLGPGKLGDMHETLDTLLDFDKGAVRDEVDDPAADLAADRVFFLDAIPRVLGQLLQPEGDALFLAVDL